MLGVNQGVPLMQKCRINWACEHTNEWIAQYLHTCVNHAHTPYISIGIKHVFLCINISWTQRVVLKPEPER